MSREEGGWSGHGSTGEQAALGAGIPGTHLCDGPNAPRSPSVLTSETEVLLFICPTFLPPPGATEDGMSHQGTLRADLRRRIWGRPFLAE